ncbi:MAG: TenA family transcriptional regulator [Leptolyngbyaceae cyanobacterium SM2_3_12]|nr:TenA family transcriptional regulator [Leptolyngbyaceae cyanobacterium SM2_3_12]
MPFSCQFLLHTHGEAWQRATVHPFLTQCQAGTLQPAQFNTWLGQDYLFVKDFTRMVGRLLGAAPDAHLDTLLSGLGALKEELLWFEAKAAERGLDLKIPRQLTCQRYCDFLASLAVWPYPVQATALWAIEYAYNQGWQLPGPMAPPYDEICHRWGNPGFTDYVTVLAAQADQALGTASAEVQAAAEAIFLRVADLEADFWQMAFSVS